MWKTHIHMLINTQLPLGTLYYQMNKLLLTLALAATTLVSSAAPSSVKATSLFDGKTLTGWKAVNPANAHYWSVVDGVITCSSGDKKMPKNTYLATEKSYKNFEFRCLFRLSGDQKTGLINSGLQYRSIIKNNKIIGYQADIGKGYWGDIYDEHRRGLLVKADLRTLKHLLKEDGWNSYTIRCTGDRHELYINGVKTCDWTETDKKFTTPGVIALQLHSGGIAKMEYKDIVIEEL